VLLTLPINSVSYTDSPAGSYRGPPGIVVKEQIF
jgi:hypothetical protein